MTKPLMIDLYAGLGGWAEGGLAEGYDVIGFDIEQHVYGAHRYPAQLVIQDALTLHGAQFRDAALIVASPPCQEYSYMAMPWSKAKAKQRDLLEGRDDPKRLTALFDACFRIQREACEAAGRHIPLVVENVRGAQKWVGRARWNYGSFYLCGDVPALMPMTAARQVMKAGVTHRSDGATNFHGSKVPGFRFDGSGKSFQSASVEHTGVKAPGMNWSDQTKRGQDFTRIAGNHATKNAGGSWFNIGSPGQKVTNQNPVHKLSSGTKIGGDRLSDPESTCRKRCSKSPGRKMASAMIAKIPLPLSRHIARTYLP